MLNYFDYIFEITNPKLYNSPYNKNIVKVRDVVKNYGIRCNLRYFFKLLSLRINENRFMFFKRNLAGLYFRDNNTIMIRANLEENLKNIVLDHELYHVAGRIIDSKNFNDGVAEDLARKTNSNHNNDMFSYELEVFVVEFLNKIFNNSVYSIFFGNGRVYKYFKKQGLLKQIKSIDKIISLHNSREYNNILFIKYLFMIKHASEYKIRGHETKDFIKFIEEFKKEKDKLKEFKFDAKTLKRIEKIFDNNSSFLYFSVPSLDDCCDYLEEDPFFNKYLEQSQNIKEEKCLNEFYFIILILTNIAKKYGYNNEKIHDLVLSLSSDKSSEFNDYVLAVSNKFFKVDNSRKSK